MTLDRDGADCASVEGLRLLGGDLVVKVEYLGAVLQVAVRGVGRFPKDGSIRVEHRFGLRMPLSAAAFSTSGVSRAARSLPGGRAGGRGSRAGRPGEGGGRAQGRQTQRGMARDIWGDARVADEWSSDGWMRSQVRRWIPKANAMVEGGWRELVPRTVLEEE